MRIPVVATVALLSLAACELHDVTTPPPMGRTPADKSERGRAEADLDVLRRFDIELQALGSLRSGEPIRLVATIRANVPTSEAQLTLAAPEIGAAELSAWNSEYRLPQNGVVPALQTVKLPLGRGQAQRIEAMLTFPQPGYYRISASALAGPKELTTIDGVPVQGHAVRELWLLVNDNGVQITAEFDPRLLPDSVLEQPGPLRPKRSRTRRFSGHQGLMTNLSTTDEMQGGDDYYRFVYWRTDVTPNRFEPLYGAVVRADYYYWDYGTPYPSGSSSARTNVNGIVSIDCPNFTSSQWGDDFYEADLTLANADIVVQDVAYSVGSGDPYSCGYSSYESPYQVQVTAAGQAHVLNNLSHTIARSMPFFGVKRSQIYVKVFPDQDGQTHYTPPYLGSYGDNIEMYRDAIWGSYGVFAAAHEYGHATQKEVLGSYSSGTCGGPHQFNLAINLTCAYAEGFADYFAAVLWEDAAYGISSVRNGEWPLYTRSGSTSYDGSIAEAPVAAFLYDLTDSSDDATEGFDQIAVPGTYLAQVMRTCATATGSGVWAPPSGIDELITCIGRNVSIYSGGYFPTSGNAYNQVQQFQESATEPANWSELNVRRLWRWNLYRSLL